jgi:hypothetical protein
VNNKKKKQEDKQKEKEVFTKEDFIEALDKVITTEKKEKLPSKETKKTSE